MLILFKILLKLDNDKSDESSKSSQADLSDKSCSFSGSDKQINNSKSNLNETPSKIGSGAISSENLSKSADSTPLKFKNDKNINEKDLDCKRENEMNKEFFNGYKQDNDFNRQCEIDDIEFVPHFQRVYISGDDNSGVNIEFILLDFQFLVLCERIELELELQFNNTCRLTNCHFSYL